MASKDVQELLNSCERLGCDVQKTRSNHYKIRTPGGQTVVVASTPSDYRAQRNNKSRLRKAGVPL